MHINNFSTIDLPTFIHFIVQIMTVVIIIVIVVIVSIAVSGLVDVAE